MENAHIERPFTLEVNGKFVAKPTSDSGAEAVPAKLGDRSNAAVFTSQRGSLKSGNRYMGRYHIEPLALIPMHVYWMDNQSSVQPCQNKGSEQEPRLQTNGMGFSEAREDGTLYAQLPMFGESHVKVHWQ